MSRSLRGASLVIAALAVAACGGDATGTKSKTITAAQAAAQLEAGIDTTDTTFSLGDLQLALAALAVGAPPVPMTVRVNGVAGTFQTESFGLVRYASGATTGYDSLVVTVGWRGDSASEGFLLLRETPTDQYGNVIPGQGLAAGGVDYWNGANGWIADVTSETAATMVDRKTTCNGNVDVDATETQGLAYALAVNLCSMADIATSATVSLQPFYGTPGSAGTVALSLARQSARGIRVAFFDQAAPSVGGARPIVPLSRAMPFVRALARVIAPGR